MNLKIIVIVSVNLVNRVNKDWHIMTIRYSQSSGSPEVNTDFDAIGDGD